MVFISLDWSQLVSTRPLLWPQLVSAWLYWSSPDSTDLYWSSLVFTGPLWSPWVFIGLIWSSLVPSCLRERSRFLGSPWFSCWLRLVIPSSQNLPDITYNAAPPVPSHQGTRPGQTGPDPNLWPSGFWEKMGKTGDERRHRRSPSLTSHLLISTRPAAGGGANTWLGRTHQPVSLLGALGGKLVGEPASSKRRRNKPLMTSRRCPGFLSPPLHCHWLLTDTAANDSCQGHCNS